MNMYVCVYVCMYVCIIEINVCIQNFNYLTDYSQMIFSHHFSLSYMLPNGGHSYKADAALTLHYTG
jgi:hypothetical protein